MTTSHVARFSHVLPFTAPRKAFGRSIADVVLGFIAAARAAAAPGDRPQRRYPPLRTDSMEQAAMAREMHRL